MGSDATGKRIVAVFLKFPEPGKVKTRLARTIGIEAAARTYRQLVGRVLEQVSRHSGADALQICYDPAERESEARQWLAPRLDAFPGEVGWLAQCRGDLGSRLAEATDLILARDPGASLAVIGSDCIELDSGIFTETWNALDRPDIDVVVGPCEDGGYFLLALNEGLPVLFRDIPWSSSETFRATLAAAKSAGLEVHSLPNRSDVDDEEDWRKLNLSERPCVFFDRDGVVNRSPGSGYVLHRDDFQLNPGIVSILQSVREKGALAILITSQKGVGKGLMPQEELDQIHRQLQVDLAKEGAAFDGVYAYTGASDCRHQPKPDPEMILSAAEEFSIDLTRSWMVGDADRDIQMGKNAKLKKTVRIKGHHPIGVEADFTLDSILKLPEIIKKFL